MAENYSRNTGFKKYFCPNTFIHMSDQCPFTHAKDLSNVDVRRIICKFHLEGKCRYNENCFHVHLSESETQTIIKFASSVYPESHNLPLVDFVPASTVSFAFYVRCQFCHEVDYMGQFRAHYNICPGRLAQEKVAHQRSRNVTCGICLEVVLDKNNGLRMEEATDNRFGILQKCKHPFCLKCIRMWRSQGDADRESLYEPETDDELETTDEEETQLDDSETANGHETQPNDHTSSGELETRLQELNPIPSELETHLQELNRIPDEHETQLQELNPITSELETHMQELNLIPDEHEIQLQELNWIPDEHETREVESNVLVSIYDNEHDRDEILDGISNPASPIWSDQFSDNGELENDDQTVIIDPRIARSCPTCRITSHFVLPSKYWIEDEEEKAELVALYKRRLMNINCVFFKRNGLCKFGKFCFYLHAAGFSPQRRSLYAYQY